MAGARNGAKVLVSGDTAAGVSTNWKDLYAVLSTRPVQLVKGEAIQLLVESTYHPTSGNSYAVTVRAPARAACVIRFDSAQLQSIQLA